MSGYIGSKSSVTQVDGYNRTEADAEFVAKAGDTMTGPLNVTGTVTADGLTLGANNANSPQILFENSDGVTGDAAISTYDDSLGTLLVMGSNFYINSSGSESRFNTSEESSGVLLNRNGDLSLLTGGTGATATTRLKINASGNVGIGTAPSTDWRTAFNTTALQVGQSGSLFNLDVSNSDRRYFMTSNALVNSSGNFQHILEGPATVYGQQGGTHRWYTAPSASAGATAAASERMQIDASGAVIINNAGSDAQLYLGGASGTSRMYLARSGTDSLLWNVDSGAMRFGNNNAERMRITAAGGIQIGTATTITSGDAAQWNMWDGSSGVFHRFLWAGATTGSITRSGYGVAYNTSSDYRLKTDAQPMTGASARVQALKPVNFEWIVDGTRVDGFLAHEAQAVVPESVTGTKDAMRDEEYEVTPAVLDDDGNETTAAVMGTRNVPDYQGIDQSKLVPLLTAALQEALNKIDTMETRLAALEGN